MKKLINIAVCGALILMGYNANAQGDIHFSQFVSSPLNINPAQAGMFDGDIRIANNYRNQWGSVSSPYKTIAVGVDGVLARPRNEKGILGGGLSFYNDNAGDSEMKTTGIGLSLAYHLPINDYQYFSFGLQGGLLQRKITYDNLYWDQQWNGLAFDQTSASGESTRGISMQTMDFATGVQWFNEINDDKRLSLGVGAFHLTRPSVDFNMGEDPIYVKYMIHGGAEIGKSTNNVVFMPNFLVMKQGPNFLANVGAEVKYIVRERAHYTGLNDEISVGFGGYYRFGDAFYALFRLGIGDFNLGVSYDLNLSGLNVATNGKGGLEVMLKFQTSFSKRIRTGVKFM